MLVRARGAASTARPLGKGSCESSRETRGLRWGVRGWRKSFGVRGRSLQDAWECWGDLVTYWEPIPLAGVQTLHSHTHIHTVKNDHNLIVWPVHVLEMHTPGGTKSLWTVFCTKRLPKGKRDGDLQGLGKGDHGHLGPAEGAACWQGGARSGEGASRAYKVKQGEGRLLVWHHATFCFVSKPWGRRC